MFVIIFFLIIVKSSFVSGWWARNPFHIPIPSIEDHNELTNQSLTVLKINDTLGRYQEIYNISSNNKKIKEGSNELDYGYKPKNKQGYIDFNSAHFYPPNGSSLNNQGSSALNRGKL